MRRYTAVIRTRDGVVGVTETLAKNAAAARRHLQTIWTEVIKVNPIKNPPKHARKAPPKPIRPDPADVREAWDKWLRENRSTPALDGGLFRAHYPSFKAGFDAGKRSLKKPVSNDDLLESYFSRHKAKKKRGRS